MTPPTTNPITIKQQMPQLNGSNRMEWQKKSIQNSIVLFTFHALRECNFVDEMLFIAFVFFSLTNIKQNQTASSMMKSAAHWPLLNVEIFF